MNQGNRSPLLSPEQEQRENKLNKRWKIFTLVYVAVIPLGFFVWYLAMDAGPMAWLCDWQAGWLGGRCSITLTLLVVLIPFLFLLIPLKMLVEKITGVKLKQQGKTKHF